MRKPLNTKHALQACYLTASAYSIFEQRREDCQSIVTNDGEIHSIIRPLYMHPNGCLSNREFFGMVTETADTLRITCRGTDSLEDWITNARLALIPAKFAGSITSGVNDLAFHIYTHICDLTLPPDKTIIVEGHSLGASIIARLATLMDRVDEIYLLACPKFADQEFAGHYRAIYGDRTYRIVNTADEVPNLPKDIPGILELHHVCDEIAFYDPTGSLADRHNLATYANHIGQLA